MFSGTCKDILRDQPDAETGEYIYKDSNGNDVSIFCDFYGSYGYTFFSTATLSNLSSLEPHFTTSSEAVIRHIRSDGSQTEATMEILSRYRNQYNLTFLFNENFDIDGNYESTSSKYTEEPYLALGFVPRSFGNKKGTKQGYSVDGTDIEFTNLDSNTHNSIKFYVKPLLRAPSSCCDYNSAVAVVKSAWYSNANTRTVETSRYLPADFSFKFMVMMGGGGAFWTYEHFPMGVALGLKFSV